MTVLSQSRKGGGGVEENRNEQVKQSYYVKPTKVGERRDSMETLQVAELKDCNWRT